ncbi:hypothetical protein [Methanonatronarchaeum sp. AMET-Sl]|uniref:hypothetical protein n=1 Tax=Methanonatronarchaeum sp. AMET-Sl TaxID=3037654 RepID=UPI00244E4EE8|nr:hypothetical protein [Methanonatronarchaeum sp. AMET-Sl]WGI17753.1 hypothetical protein QEN48_01740 [Methanonatronarchaeum sp. AMET-Sl]
MNHKEEKCDAQSCDNPNHNHNQDHKHEENEHVGHLEKDNLNSFTLTGTYELSNSLSQSRVMDEVGGIVNWLGDEAIGHGAPVIGHIKGWVEMQDKFRFSFVNVEEGVDLDGSIDPEVMVSKFSFKMLAVIPLDDSKLDVLRSDVERELEKISD